MREIKFRAWDKKQKLMFNDVSTGTLYIFDYTRNKNDRAWQFTDKNKDRLLNDLKSLQMNIYAVFDENKLPAIKIPTLEGEMMASLGDWIIKGINGEIYPCKPDIFEKTYEKVD